jgi:hypothetical protein
MEAQPAEPTPFQKFEALTRRIMSVPKSEIDRRAKAVRKQSDDRKKSKAG